MKHYIKKRNIMKQNVKKPYTTEQSGNEWNRGKKGKECDGKETRQCSTVAFWAGGGD